MFPLACLSISHCYVYRLFVFCCCYNVPLEMQRIVVDAIVAEMCVKSRTAYRNDQPDGLRKSCAEDERRAEKPETPLHLREDREAETIRSSAHIQEDLSCT